MIPALDVQSLCKRYAPDRPPAVEGLSFTLPQGGTLGLLGGNGAGKTTTIGMLLGLLVPSSGRITALGHDMARDRFAALARMNFSSPYLALPHRLSVEENLRVYGHLYGVKKLSARIAELAHDLQLTELLDRPAGDLSAGQKTRVALAKALINRPPCCCWTSRPRASTPTPATGCAPGWSGPGPRRLRHPARLPQHGRGGTPVRPRADAQAGPRGG
jgi:ABC-2 type transport system ATP-binding protein